MSSAIIKSFNGYNLCDQYARDKVDLIDDYIVAQGTSGDWTYAKYNSGRAVMTCEISVSSLTTSSSFGGFYRSGVQRVSLPFSLVSTADCVVNASIVSSATAFAVGCTYTVDQVAYFIASTSSSTFTGTVELRAEGRWQ